MKKNLKRLGTLALLSVVGSGLISPVSAANFGGKKYYINPGHGGHDSNDRPTPLPLNVVMFYESDGNLSRGLFLQEFLKKYGAQVKMSRTTNTSADDLALSTIVSQSNSYAGYFMSLHTNGANASANYIVSFFRTSASYPTTESVAGGKAMATAVSNWHNNNHLTNFTYTTPRALGDYSFYGYNLGVLRNNLYPGHLVETVFHDYRPDGLRLKSDVYNKYTAWQILMATREKSGNSAGMTDNVNGCIIGDIRDLSESCGYTSYVSRGRDTYLAVNGATVRLLNSSGAEVSRMTTDNCANGLFGFFDVAPGTYTVEVSKTGYKTQSKSLTVNYNASTKWLVDLVKGVNAGISTSPAAAQFDNVTLGTNQAVQEIQITVERNGFTTPITITSSNPEIFPVNQTQVPHGTNNLMTFKVKFTPTAAGNHKGTVTLSGGGYTYKLSVSGTAVNPPLALETGFEYGDIKGMNPAWLPSGGWSLLRNMCFGNGKLYVVNPSQSVIYIVDARTCELLGTLDMTGVAGGTFAVMDVKYVSGKVLACNLACKADEPVKVYAWDGDDAKPTCILNTLQRDGVSRLGDTFDVEGNLGTGSFIFAYGGTDGDDSRVFRYAISNGSVSEKPSVIRTQNDDGSLIKLGISPRAIANGDDQYWVMGQSYQPVLIGSDGKAVTAMNTASLEGVISGNDMEMFNFKGSPYVAATTYAPVAGSVTKALTRGGAALIDATNGVNDGELLTKYPYNGLGTAQNTNFSTSVDVHVNGEKGVEMWVLVSNQGLGYYKYGQPKNFNGDDPTLTAEAVDLDFGELAIGESLVREFNVSGKYLKDKINIDVTGNGFMVSPKSISAEQAAGKVKVVFAPTTVGEATGTLTISTQDADDLTFTLSGKGYSEDVPLGEAEIESLTEVWNYSATNGTAGSWASLSTPHTRSFAVNGDELYVLNASTTLADNTLLVVDAKTGKDTGRRLSLTGVSGGIWPLSHIEMVGTSLYGSNCAPKAGTLKIYRWKDAAGDPEVVATFAVPSNWERLGEILGVWGDENNGKLMAYFVDNLVVFDITNGVVNQTPTVITLPKTLGGMNSTNNVLYNGDNTYTIVTKDNPPVRINAQGTEIERLPESALTNKYGTDAKMFDFGSKRYMAATAYKVGSITGGVLNVVDITDGLSKGVLKFSMPEAANGLGTATNAQFVTDVEVQILDGGRTVDIYALVPLQGVAMYTYTAPAPAVGYKPAHDPITYEEREMTDFNTKVALENNWVRHETANPLDLNIELHRDMAARYDAATGKDIVYIISRDKATADAKTALTRYDGETGEQLPTLELTYDAAWSPGYYPGNGLKLDDDKRLVTHTLSLANNNLGIAVVDPETGKCTTMLVDKTEKRIDHLDVAGSVADGSEWYAIAGSPDAVTRWTMKGKTIVRKEVMNLPSTVGNASRVYAIDGKYFWLNGQSVHASLYEFGNTTPLATLDEDVKADDLQATVVRPFSFNGKNYLLFQNNSPSDGMPVQWKLAIGNNFTRTVDNAQHIWTFPEFGLGTARMVSSDFGAPVSVVTDVKPETRQTPVARLYAYSPGNGMASYTLRPLVTDGVENIAVDGDCSAEWYTLGGMRIDRPTIPGMYIKVTGRKVEKVTVK